MNPDSSPAGLQARLAMLHEVADAVAAALRDVADWGPSGLRIGQYAADLVADDAALRVLRAAGVGVLSEESGVEGADLAEMVVVDPLDGSTNASRGVPYFATSLCLLDAAGPAVALVANQSSGVRYWAVRGGGSFRDGEPITPTVCREPAHAFVGMNGLPPVRLGFAQARVLGAVALDLCLVASGVFDGYVDCVDSAHGSWDYLAGMLICQEAGAVVVDAFDRELVVRTDTERRTPVAAATPELLAHFLEARRGYAQPSDSPGA